MSLDGIYDGFAEWSDLDLARPLTGGDFEDGRVIVVFDTNTLLQLYKTKESSRADFFAALERVRPHVFAPRETIREYWKNRLPVIRGVLGTFTTASNGIRGDLGKVVGKLEAWSKDSRRPWGPGNQDGGELTAEEQADHERYLGILDQIRDLEDSILSYLQEQQDETVTFSAEPNAVTGMIPGVPADVRAEDPILEQLARLFDGRVGPAPDRKRHAQLEEEWEKRVADGIHPGITDKDKAGGEDLGDFLIWHQTIERAKEIRDNDGRQPHILFITNELKIDWWRNAARDDAQKAGKSPLVGAHPDLVREYRREVGRDGIVYMMSSTQFLRFSADNLQVSLSEGTVQDFESTSVPEAPSGTTLFTHWIDGVEYRVLADHDEDKVYVRPGFPMRGECDAEVERAGRSAIQDREDLQAEGIVIPDEDTGDYVFTEDYVFRNLTHALRVICGAWGSGRGTWRAEDADPED